MRPLVVRLAQFNEAEGGISQSCPRAISSTALPTAGPMRSMWVWWPGTPGRLRTERLSLQTKLVFRDEAANEKHVAWSFRFPLPASPRITRPTIVADSSKSRYRKECRRALARESNPQARYRPGGTFLRFKPNV